MNASPVRCQSLPARQQAPHTRHGGNLARAISTRAGHFSLAQSPQYLGADASQVSEAAACLPSAALQRAGAAMHRPVSVPAKSRPHFSQINHVAHGVLPSVRKTTKEERVTEGFVIRG